MCVWKVGVWTFLVDFVEIVYYLIMLITVTVLIIKNILITLKIPINEANNPNN